MLANATISPFSGSFYSPLTPQVSPAGLTRGAIFLRKKSLRRRWIAGSSPAMPIPASGNALAVRGTSLDRAPKPRSDLELRSLDPVPEIRAGRLLQIARIHGLAAAEGDEVVLVVVRGQALHEGLFGDVILAPGSLAAEAFDRKPRHGLDHVVLRGPAAVLGFGRVLHRRLVRGDREIGAVGFPFGIILVGPLVPSHELLGQRRPIRVVEIERVVAEQDALGRELLLHQRVLPSRGREHELAVLG